MGQHGLGCLNENEEQFRDFSAFNGFHSLMGAFFPTKPFRRPGESRWVDRLPAR